MQKKYKKISSEHSLNSANGNEPIPLRNVGRGSDSEHFSGIFSRCNCCMKSFNEDYSGMHEKTYVCRWGYCCKWCCGISCGIALLVLIAIFAAIIPIAAHSSMDTAQLIPQYIGLINPTENGITINSTMQIVNAGSWAATIASSKGSLHWNGHRLGTLSLPSISVEATIGATFSMMSDVEVNEEEKVIFQRMTRLLLNGTDVTMTLKTETTVQPKVMGISLLKYTVNMEKDLVVPGAKLQNMYIRDMTMGKSNATTVLAKATGEFSSPSTLHLFDENAMEVNVYDAHANQLGYAVFHNFTLQSGYNRVENSLFVLQFCEHCSNTSSSNMGAVITFATRVNAGQDTLVKIIGPRGDLVISNTMTEDINIYPPCPTPPS